ncbi:MCE family protein [Nocardia nova]|uniref:Mammalian cell entry protein n=1 Tax=Nocardia nova TaxID=37330 RepID=A0A2S6A1W1_9NOCA|nr:MCE family protein [Nocardia nova]PPJ25560.1 mammalian cell entry protein [Nocardia nova]
MTTISEGSRSRFRAAGIGVAMIALLLALTVLSVAIYKDAFTSTAKVVIRTDRSGLMMDAGSQVEISGKVVGRVTGVSIHDTGTTIEMALQSDQLKWIPANVGAELSTSTLFGRKYVSLVRPAHPSARRLAAGAVIDAREVSVEFQDVLGKLMSVLEQVDPAQVDTVLTQSATAVRSRGGELGRSLQTLSSYLHEFNGSIPTLQRDLPKLADNADTLAALSPDLLGVLNNGAVTGQTVTDKQSALAAFLLSFTGLGNTGNTFFTASRQALPGAVEALDPVTGVLADYAPEYQCLLSGLVQADDYLTHTLGGARPGLNILGTIPMGDPPYTQGNLPKVGDVSGPPSCYGSHDGVTAADPGHTDFDDGSRAYETPPSEAPGFGADIAELLFGRIK